MRSITSHHDGHGLNESIVIAADEPGPGGASHRYVFLIDGTEVGALQFQCGPRNVEGSTPGITEGAFLMTLIDRLECFQAGPYACEENAVALEKARECLAAIRLRADNRAARGVLGTYNK